MLMSSLKTLLETGKPLPEFEFEFDEDFEFEFDEEPEER
jgi:hypothetical protein